MNFANSLLILGVLALSHSLPALAQTKKPPVKPALTAKKPVTATVAPSQATIDQAFEAALTQAKNDRTKILSEMKTDQLNPTTEALCRITVNQLFLESIDDFETRAADLKRFSDQHRTQIESERDALTRAMDELPSFYAEVIPVESQTKVERLGLAKFNWTTGGQIQVSLEQVVTFLDLISARIQYCAKDPETREAKLQQVTASLENPFSNPTGLTYSQVMAAIQALSGKLNASLKIRNSEFELRFADPVENETCDAGLELIQNIKTDGDQKLRAVFKLAPSTVAGQIKVVNAPQSGQPYPNELVFRSINESNLTGVANAPETSFDGYARLVQKLQSTQHLSVPCLESLTKGLTDGFLDAPYLSPQHFAKNSISIRLGGSNDIFPKTKTQFAFGNEHGVYLDSKKELWIWGAECGLDANTDRENPTRLEIPPGITVTQIAAGHSHTAILLSNGSVRVFGHAAMTAPLEVHLKKAPPVIRLFANNDMNFTLHQDGSVQAFMNTGAAFSVFLPNRELPRDFAVVGELIYVLSQSGKIYSIPKSNPSQMATLLPGAEKVQFQEIQGSGALYAVSKTGELFGIGTFTLAGAPASSPSALVRFPFEKGKIKSAIIYNASGYILLTDGTLWSVGIAVFGQMAGSLKNPAQVNTPSKNTQKFWYKGFNLFVLESDGIWGIGQGDEGELGNGVKSNSDRFVRTNLPAMGAAK